MRAFLALLAFLFISPAFAQEATPEEERGWLLGFIEDQLSAPNRQIRLQGIQGVLSSNASIGLITVADDDGIWMRIENARIVWSRSALIFSQRLHINTLAADRIDVVRQPLPDESLPSPEASSFELPELPIGIRMDALDVPLITFGRDVFGLESQLSLTGRLTLEDGALDTALDITRLDGPGGTFNIAATYANQSQQLALDVKLSEPENGIVANVLNIDGKPPVDLTITGQGPLSALDVNLNLDAASQRILTGELQLREQNAGLGYTARLNGPIAQLIPVQFRDFFGAQTSLALTGVSKESGGMRVESLRLHSAALDVSASAETGSDGFLERLALDAKLDDGTNERILLPVPGGQTTVQRAGLTLSFGESANEEWNGLLTIEKLATAEFAADEARVSMGGLARNLSQANARSITFAADGLLSGIVATRKDINEALGNEISLDIDGAWNAGQPIRLANALLSGNGLSLSLIGEIAEMAFKGDIALEARSIAPFSALAEQDLQGSLALKATGDVHPISGAFDLTIDSAGNDLQIGNEAIDNLLAEHTTITGRIARGAQGIVADNLRIGNERIELKAQGNIASSAADFNYTLSLADLALLTSQANGQLEAKGRAIGTDGNIALTTQAQIAAGSLAGKRLSDALIAFEGNWQKPSLTGKISGNAFLDGVRAQLAASIATEKGETHISDLDFTAGGARLSGNVSQSADGLLNGILSLNAADVSTAAALFLAQASGAVQAEIALAEDQGQQTANITANIQDFQLDETRIGSAQAKVLIEDLFNVTAINGTVNANKVVAGGVDIASLQANALSNGDTTSFEANAALANSTKAHVLGTLSPEGEGWRLALNEASLGQGMVAARLVQPASLLVIGDNITIDDFLIDVAGGRISAKGTAARQLDLAVNINKLPLSIVNLVRPDLGLGGTIDADASVAGTREQPQARFTLNGNSITADSLRQAGQSTLTIRASGSTTMDQLNIDANISSPEGMRATIRGGVPLNDGALALDVDLASFPLAALNRALPGNNLGGTATGKARIGGTIANPQASFDVRGSGLRATPLQDGGISSLDLTTAGRFANETVTLTSLSLRSPEKLAIDASGTIPLSGNGLSVNLTGSAPLAIANRFLSERGTQLSGVVEVNGSVSGSIQKPAIRGMFSTSGAQLVDPETNLRVHSINLMGAMEGETVTLRSANAALASGGTVSASGTVSINAAAGFPADLRLVLDKARYTDGEMIFATMDGSLSITGALARDPLIAGNIEIDRAEIAVPENLSGGAAAIDVVHRNASANVRETLVRARANDGTPTPSARPTIARLDVTVNAPARIFIRGRGLDTELGGRVRLTGSASDIQPVGGFNLIRGRLSILGQRITFDEGSVTLVGDLDPMVNFVARSVGSDITVFINVRGQISALDISFSSQPQLPEDEVLARLIFNRGLNELSPIQIAQLAAAAAELAGGSNTSLLGNLRNATGLDDLDIVTDKEGNAAVRAGRYIQDNIYLGVEAGAGGTTRGTVNLDISEKLKARGAVGSDGDSSLGLFFEHDY